MQGVGDLGFRGFRVYSIGDSGSLGGLGSKEGLWICHKPYSLTLNFVNWPSTSQPGSVGSCSCECPRRKSLVAEWIHFTLFGIILPTIKRKVYTFGGLCTLQLSAQSFCSQDLQKNT